VLTPEQGSGAGGPTSGKGGEESSSTSSSPTRRTNESSQSTTKAAAVTPTPSVAVPITAATLGPAIVAPEIGRFDAAGVAGHGVHELATLAQFEIVFGPVESVTPEPPRVARRFEVEAVEAGLGAGAMDVAGVGEALEAGVARDLSAAPTMEAITQLARWFGERPFASWMPWLTAAALAGVAGELSRRQLRARKAVGVAVLPEDIVGWIPERL